MILQFSFLWRHLHENVNPKSGRLYKSFGLANWLSLIRGALVAFMAGFLVGLPPVQGLVWAPGTLYILANIMDFLDGYAARSLGQSTPLGEVLDMSLDGTGVLVGALLAWRFDQAPLWFVLVGLARFLFLFGGWMRKRLRKPIFPLSDNPYRRALAGSQMLFIGIILLPIYPPTVARWAATFFMLPFLAGFFRDWLVFSGQISEKSGPDLIFWKKLIKGGSDWVSLFLRIFLIATLTWVVIAVSLPFQSGLVWVGMALINSFLLFGLVSRGIAVVLMMVSGYLAGLEPVRLEYWVIFFVSMALFFIGSGRFSKWSPEDHLIFQRAGKRRTGEG
ncbi:MAG: CDP-alcohol phosphatidyltransferase family protein [Anaerolineae bacterium]|nr:CDP-alcohol phosphatidyltransferase family protein [Anaerolineae bacterium]